MTPIYASDETVKKTECCVACGHAATATWHGEAGSISVCGPCAVEVLPNLIADAVDLPRTWSSVKSLVTYTEGKLWRAITCRLYRGSDHATN